MEERLQKFLARAGIASRREAEKMIISGKVKVNDRVVKIMGTTVRPHVDQIKVEEKLVKIPENNIYLLMNKPKGYITTAKDEKNRPTVLDLLGEEINERVYPIGRLDKDTEGLLIISNDGSLAYGLTHPKYEILKTYHALVKGVPKKEDLQELRKGIPLDQRITYSAKVSLLKDFGDESLIEISIHEGRNQQVRRMFKHIGYPVLYLRRERLAFLELGSLKTGEYRMLTSSEVKRLYNLINKNKA